MPFAPLIGEVGGLAAAFLAFLLCVAAAMLIRAIAAVLDAIPLPIVGAWISGAFKAIATPVESWLVGASNELWSDVEFWGRAIAWLGVTLFDDVKNAFVWDGQQIDHLFSTAVPQSALASQASTLSHVNEQLRTLHGDIASATTAIERTESALAARDLAKAEQHASTVKASLTKIAAHDLTHAETYADAAIARFKDYAENAYAKASALPKPLTADIDYATPAAVAIVGTAVAAITKEFEECGVTSCAGPNQLSSLLPSLLGLVSYGVLLDFITKAISDPTGAEAQYAGQFASLVAPFVNGTGSIVDEIGQAIGL